MPCTSTAQAWLMLRKCRACDLIVCSWRFFKLVLIGQRESLAKAHCIEADDFGLAGHVGEGLDGHRPCFIEHSFVHLGLHAVYQAQILSRTSWHVIQTRGGLLSA